MSRQTTNDQIFTKRKIQLSISVFLFTFLFVACNSRGDKKQADSTEVKSGSTPSSVTQNDTIDAIVKSIIDISVTDFYKNQRPLPVAFRNVQIKYFIKPNKEVLHILCGEFATQKNGEWIHFTTIKNSDYEQWLGNSGLTYCENSKEIPYTKTDLSLELKSRLDSMQKSKK